MKSEKIFPKGFHLAHRFAKILYKSTATLGSQGVKMSEDLLQTTSAPIGRYRYFRLGASTLGQLRRQGVIQGPVPKDIHKNRPDGLITLGNGAVKAWIEYKTPENLNTSTKLKKAISQSIKPARSLCNLLVITDGENTHWINPHTGKALSGDHQPLPPFNALSIIDGSATAEYLMTIEDLVDKADYSLDSNNDALCTPETVNPARLARRIWQNIWINTGKEPIKCLYNVVELFVFKYLSDLSVIPAHCNFSAVYSMWKDYGDNERALMDYADRSRPEILKLFPAGNDNTSIINGTIFVNEQGKANKAQARLFCEALDELQAFDEENGSLKHISKEFKTRLYESFLGQEAGLHLLGQFFTPRNVVQAIVEMSGADTLPSGARVCDPFCGVGGFLLEVILQTPRIMDSFSPNNGEIKPDVELIGFDRGSYEKEDERTIILSKANTLIYFSELLSRYNTEDFIREFSQKVVNSMFHLIRSNLGTFELEHDDRYDLILTNPPYVTSGSRSVRMAIDDAGHSNRFSVSGRGTESLAMQWIIRSLKPGGTAITIVPDGLLNQQPMLDHIKAQCIVKGIISLPPRTFYATTKKTYILILERKRDGRKTQSDPVFTYLVSETGETRDANRWTIFDNHLLEAASLYNQFKGSPTSFSHASERCKSVDWTQFDSFTHWMLDRICWSDKELAELGDLPEDKPATISEFNSLIQRFSDKAKALPENMQVPSAFTEVLLGDQTLFELMIGSRVLKKECIEDGVPCISANVNDIFGYIEKSTLITHFDTPSLTWGIDGTFDWHFIPAGQPFHPTDHCGVLRVLDDGIDPLYLFYMLKETRNRHGFDRTYRANLDNVAKVSVDIPTGGNGHFDIEKQREMATLCKQVDSFKQEAANHLKQIVATRVAVISQDQ